jgi:hypothetical protein
MAAAGAGHKCSVDCSLPQPPLRMLLRTIYERIFFLPLLLKHSDRFHIWMRDEHTQLF